MPPRRLLVLCALAAGIVLAPAAHNAEAPPTLDRLRLEIAEAPAAGGIGAWLSRIPRLLKLHAGGVISPKAGTTFRVTAVAYSSTTDQTDFSSPCVTASGARVGRDVVATNFLPFGTRIRIDDKRYVVRDRMNAKYNGKYIIDIWHQTRKEALAFGAKPVTIEILGPEEPMKKPDGHLKQKTSRATPAGMPPSSPPPTGFLAQARESVQRLAGLFQRFVPGRAYLPKDVDCLTDE